MSRLWQERAPEFVSPIYSSRRHSPRPFSFTPSPATNVRSLWTDPVVAAPQAPGAIIPVLRTGARQLVAATSPLVSSLATSSNAILFLPDLSHHPTLSNPAPNAFPVVTCPPKVSTAPKNARYTTLMNSPPRLPTHPTSLRPYPPLQAPHLSLVPPKPAATPNAQPGHAAPLNAPHPRPPLRSSTVISPTCPTRMASVIDPPLTAPSEHPASVVPSRPFLTIPCGRASLVSPRQFRQCSTHVMDKAASRCLASTIFGNPALSTHWA